MFSTFKQRLLLGIYVFILLSIPVGAYLSAQYTNTQSQASEQKSSKPIAKVTPKPIAKPSSPTAKELLNVTSTAGSSSEASSSASPEPSSSSPTIATSFGPTLSFKVALEGRPAANQTGKVFVGIAEGTPASNPKFVLNFNVNLPASGEYQGLSLAGLSPGSKYTALIKGPAQIANAVTFTMSPIITNLSDGQTVNLTSGDLNEDNVINSADYSIIQKALGTSSNSSNWNENTDLNKDGIINTFDLGIVSKNLGKTGASGAWTSPIPKTATASASLSTGPSAGSPQDGG
ncbi:hypothetical protein HYU94_00645, partial [Candidatus Daviesbacteria bacterium]|nr:hypothetical protein [Candidatus Daviesbacteria bacterium]